MSRGVISDFFKRSIDELELAARQTGKNRKLANFDFDWTRNSVRKSIRKSGKMPRPRTGRGGLQSSNQGLHQANQAKRDRRAEQVVQGVEQSIEQVQLAILEMTEAETTAPCGSSAP